MLICSAGSILDVGGVPMLKHGEMDPVGLRLAAVPSLAFEDGRQEFTFVCPTLAGITVRLTWLEDERVMTLFFIGSFTLRRKVNEANASISQRD